MFRAIFLTFFGEYRGGAAEEHEQAPAIHDEQAHGAGHDSAPHESPSVMTLPLLILAVPALLAGFANLPWKYLGIDHEIERLLVGALPDEGLVEEGKFRLGIALASTGAALGGIFLAWAIYQAKVISSASLARLFMPLHRLLENKYYLDALYERVVVGKVFYQGLGRAAEQFDRLVVDGAVNGVGQGTRQAGSVLRHLQSGQFQAYGALAFSGLVVTAVLVLILNPL
jgi:NADH-quinone oxidoreductase subunit L